MKILELRAENVKRLVAVTIKPDGNVVEIHGENGAGKSSVLDSIAYALGGKELHPPEVIRRGQENAQVVVDLGDRIIRRRWTAGGSSLTVESKDGARFPSPQAWLDKVIGSLSFDPLAFIRLEPKKQVETVRNLVGVDTKVIDDAHAALFARRTTVTAEGKAMRARYDALPVPADDVPDEPVSVDQLLNEQAQLQEKKAANDHLRQRRLAKKDAREAAARRVELADQLVTRLERELGEANAKMQAAMGDLAAAKTAEGIVETEAAALVDPDVADVVRRISRASFTNDAVRAKKERIALHAQLELKREEQKALAMKLEQLVDDKAKLLASARFPVPGLGFTSEGLTLGGLPIEQASSAEQLRLGVAMGFALNPTLKVVLIHDGSLLDAKSLALVGEMAAAAGGQVWIERVGTGPVGFEIVDGQLAAPAASSAA